MDNRKHTKGITLLAATSIALAMSPLAFTSAHAETFNEITADWAAGTPNTLNNGAPALMNVKVNANDDKGAAGVQDPLIVKVSLAKGAIQAIPGSCKTTGVDTPSSISADGATLTCNLGSIKLGTAAQFDLGVLASGADGDQLLATVSTELAEPVELTPIAITATQGVDLYFNDNSTTTQATSRTATPDIALPFSIAVPVGAEQIADTVSWTITVDDSVGSLSQRVGPGRVALGAGTAMYPTTPKNNDTSGATGTIEETSPGVFRVTISGMDTSLSNLPTTSNNGTQLAADRNYIVSGIVYLATESPIMSDTESVISSTFTASDITATTMSGLPAPDVDGTNQLETRNIPLAGNRSAAWAYGIGYDNAWSPIAGAGSSWANNGFVLPGDVVGTFASSNQRAGQSAANAPAGYGICTIIDFGHARLATTDLAPASPGAPYIDAFSYSDPQVPSMMAFIGDPGEQRDFDCGGTTGWVNLSTVSDPSTVGAVRMMWTKEQQSTVSYRRSQLNLPVRILPGQAAGEDIWTVSTFTGDAGTEAGGLNWATANTSPRGADNTVTGTSLPGDKYPTMTSTSDVIHIADHRVSAAKSASPTNLLAGEQTTFTLTGNYVTATGGTLGSLDFVDTLPVGLQYVDGSASVAPTSVVANADGTTTVTWNDVATSAAGIATLTFNAKATAATTLRNTVVVNNAGTPSTQNEALDTDTATASVSAQEVSQTVLDKKVAADEFIINGTNTWTLSLTNEDAVRTQTTWDIIDILPYNGDNRSTAYNGSYTIGDVVVPAGATAYYTDADPATLKGDPGDTSNGTFGDITNNTVNWSTTKPANVTGIRIIGSDLAPLETVETQIPFTTTGNKAGDVYDNIATAKATLTALQMIRAEDTAVIADGSTLQIDKALMPDQPVVPGQQISYTITVRNSGEGVAKDVVMTDQASTGLVPGSVKIHDMQQGTAEGNVWSIGDLQPGQIVTAQVDVVIAEDADVKAGVTNAAVVENPSNPHVEGECSPNDVVQDDTDQCDVVTVVDTSKLKIDKAVIDADVRPGGTVTYKVTAQNAGTSVADQVVVDDSTLDGLENPVFSDPQVGTVDGDKWNVGAMKPGDTFTATVTATIKADADVSKPVINGVTISNPTNPKEDFDPSKPASEQKHQINPGDVTTDTDQADSVPVVNLTKLKVDKAVIDADVKPGGTVTYTITAMNAGKEDAASVVVDDTELDGLENPVFSKPSQGSVKGAQWSIGTLKAGQTVTATVTATIKADADMTKPIINGVTISNPAFPKTDFDPSKPASEQPHQINPGDVTTDNDQSDSVPVLPAKLAINKKFVDDKQTASPNGTVTYVVEGANLGQGNASDVTITDLPKDGLLDDSITVVGKPSKGEFNAATGIWTVGDLAPNEVVSITVSVKVSATAKPGDQIINAAVIENPTFPVPSQEKCQVNDDLKSDNDQCDNVTLEIPTPNPLLPKTGEDLAQTGGILAVLGLAAGLVAALNRRFKTMNLRG